MKVSDDQSERVRELWALPKSIVDLHETANMAEFAHYIWDVFWYDVTAIDDDDHEELYHRYVSLWADGDSHLRRVCACRAFVGFVNDNGGPEDFALAPASLLEWFPR